MEQQVEKKAKVKRSWLGNAFHAISKGFSTIGSAADAMDKSAKNYGLLATTQSSKAVKQLDKDIKKEFGVGIIEFNKEIAEMVDEFYD